MFTDIHEKDATTTKKVLKLCYQATV